MSKLLIADCTSRSDSRRKARRSASSEHLEGEQGEVIVGMPVPWALSRSCLHLGALPAMALGEEPGLRAATGSGRWRMLPVALPQPRSVALSFFDFQAKHLILLVGMQGFEPWTR